MSSSYRDKTARDAPKRSGVYLEMNIVTIPESEESTTYLLYNRGAKCTDSAEKVQSKQDDVRIGAVGKPFTHE